MKLSGSPSDKSGGSYGCVAAAYSWSLTWASHRERPRLLRRPPAWPDAPWCAPAQRRASAPRPARSTPYLPDGWSARAALQLHQPNAGEHMQRLAQRMGVPGCARRRLERDAEGLHPRRRGNHNFIQPHRAGKPFLRPAPASTHLTGQNIHGTILTRTANLLPRSSHTL